MLHCRNCNPYQPPHETIWILALLVVMILIPHRKGPFLRLISLRDPQMHELDGMEVLCGGKHGTDHARGGGRTMRAATEERLVPGPVPTNKEYSLSSGCIG